MGRRKPRITGLLGVQSVGHKTEKVTICLAPQTARRLRCFSAYHGLDLGDVVSAGLRLVLKGFSADQRPEAQPATQPTEEAA